MQTRVNRKQKGRRQSGQLQRSGTKQRTSYLSYFTPLPPSPSSVIVNPPHITPPDVRFIKNDPDVLKFGKCYFDPATKEIVVRTDRLRKPIGGPSGAVLRINPESRKIVKAEYMLWPEWMQLREELKLTQVKTTFDYVEIPVSVLQAALNGGRP